MKKIIVIVTLIGWLFGFWSGYRYAKNKSRMFLLKPVFDFKQECIRGGGEWGTTTKDGYKIECCFTKELLKEGDKK